ncbi:uncharacterized protein LOC111372004 [Olea europaea var. sylvestris]|uniref:uncharacterized protein LOC111372004 n=1 Tax=Olea europaea var. sylvestris TaxID=158386 RepID=UPI000C1D753B|nr:uncharacterized protein LOC111372004 [Olea europaea var. sylvestris]
MSDVEEQDEGYFNNDSDKEDITFNYSDYIYSPGEEDDMLFAGNVSQNVELDVGNLLEAADESDNSEYAPSDDIRSIHSDSDEVVTYPEFEGDVDMVDPVLEVGLKFRLKKELKVVVKNFSIANRFEVHFPYNDRHRLDDRCKDKKCPWRIWASPLEEDSAWQIKSFEWNHTCSRAFNNISVFASWLAHTYIETYTIALKWDVKLFKTTVLKEHGVEISDAKAWRARRYAKGLLGGSLVGQFLLLDLYAAEVRRTNPRSIVILSLDELVFKAIYVCFDACKKGFLGGCRPVICIDGCFLKGNFGDQLLALVGIDGKDCIFPIAHAIVETESNASWSWFLKLLGEDLMLENAYGVIIMSDRQKGSDNMVSELFPMAKYRFCVRHMYSNFFRKDFKSLTLRDLLWRAAKSTYLAEFTGWMDKIKEEKKPAWEWLCAKPAEQWSKSHFMTASKCDILLNNLYECFNNYIKEAKGKDILTLLQSIQNKVMVRMYKCHDFMARSSSDICPKILKKLESSIRDSFSWKAIFNGKMQFQVSGPYSDGQFVVDLQTGHAHVEK